MRKSIQSVLPKAMRYSVDRSISPTEQSEGTLSNSAPLQPPRVWSPPPTSDKEDRTVVPTGLAEEIGQLGSYWKRRRALLDILNSLHSTGCVAASSHD
jgi:hypothetical protein